MGSEYKCSVCGELHGEDHYTTGSYNSVGMITKNNEYICPNCKKCR